jgi:hypothetical protein
VISLPGVPEGWPRYGWDREKKSASNQNWPNTAGAHGFDQAAVAEITEEGEATIEESNVRFDINVRDSLVVVLDEWVSSCRELLT